MTSRSRWIVLLGVSGIYVSFGLIVASTGALVPSIRSDLDLSRGQMGLILGAWQLAYIGASVPAGRVIDRIGLRRALLLSIAIMVSSAILRSMSTGFTTMLLSVGVLGIGGPLISIGAPKAAAILFDGVERGRAVGIYGTSPAIGGALALATANGLVGNMVDDSWRSVTLVFAAFGALTGVLWFFVSDGLEESDGQTQDPLPARELLALPVVRVVLVAALLGFTFSHGIGQWLVDLLADGGRTTSTAGYLAAVGSVIGMVGSLVIPPLATPRRRVPVLTTALVIGAFGTVALTVTGPAVIGAITASSLARVGVMPVCMLILMDHPAVGSRNIAVAGGLFFTAAQFGGFGGPYLTGLLADTSGGFTLAVLVHATLMITLAVFVMSAVPRVTR